MLGWGLKPVMSVERSLLALSFVPMNLFAEIGCDIINVGYRHYKVGDIIEHFLGEFPKRN